VSVNFKGVVEARLRLWVWQVPQHLFAVCCTMVMHLLGVARKPFYRIVHPNRRSNSLYCDVIFTLFHVLVRVTVELHRCE
jgi:hypothetical protein